MVLSKDQLVGDLLAQVVTWLLQGAIRITVQGVTGWLSSHDLCGKLGVLHPERPTRRGARTRAEAPEGAAPPRAIQEAPPPVAVRADPPTPLAAPEIGIAVANLTGIRKLEIVTAPEEERAPPEAPPEALPSGDALADILAEMEKTPAAGTPVVALTKPDLSTMSYEELLTEVKATGVTPASKKKVDVLDALRAYYEGI